MFSGTAQVSNHVFQSVCQFCVSSCVTMADKNKAVVRCLLATTAIMVSEKKKKKRNIWSKK
jgi:hypothetical protein